MGTYIITCTPVHVLEICNSTNGQILLNQKYMLENLSTRHIFAETKTIIIWYEHIC